MLTIEEIKERVRPICEKYKVDRMWLFGSYARGEADEKSDVDLCVEGAEYPDWTDWLQIEDDLKDAMGLPVDVVDREGLRFRFRKNMKKDEILIYERRDA